MSSIRNLLCATLAVGVLLSASRAEARFGKHSDSSDSSNSTKSKTHNATAVGDNDSKQDDSPRRHSSAGLFLVDLLLELILDTRPAVAYVPPPPPPPAADATPSSEVQTSSSEPSPLFARMGMDGAALSAAAGVSAFLGIEGERAGVDAHALALTFPTDDGTTSRDRITLTNFHLTYALIAQERARLRIEGGLSSAHAPDLIMIGPSIALSLEAGLSGNLDLELRAQGTPYPYRQLDAQAGLALHLNSVVLRGGWRTLYLNDNGLVDDVVHKDTFGGPYAGVGFAF